jgi:tetratricopeptide (TPR) repeat protein
MSIKGFASPESPYSNNTRLASGRTEALKTYVNELYHLPEDLIKTSFEPENWEGLRAYVDSSDLAHRSEILEIIDSDRDPDNKEWKIKSTYKDEYQYLLKNCYPALRRSDYHIEYEVRSYMNVSEIARVFYEKPQNLSLNEMYAYAQELDKDSEEFFEVFETAVRMFPDDQIANINAANIAMKRGEFNKAKRYLEKSGDSPQAMYARGIYEYLNGNIDMAAAIFSDALRKGVTEAEIPIARIQEMKDIQKKYMRSTTSSSY